MENNMEKTENKEVKYTIGQVCEMLNVEDYTLRYIEKSVNLKIERDEYLNRLYTEQDIEKIKMILDLREKGVTYSGIRKVIDMHENTESEEENIENNDSKALVIKPNQNIETLISRIQGIVEVSIEEVIGERLQKITDELNEIKKQNINLQKELEAQQQRHFENLDRKLTSWREEYIKRQEQQKEKKTFFQKLFRK